MDQLHFIQQVRRLKSKYGPEAYPREAVTALYSHFRSLSNSTYSKIICEAIRHLCEPPGVLELKEILKQIEKPNQIYQEETNNWIDKLNQETESSESFDPMPPAA